MPGKETLFKSRIYEDDPSIAIIELGKFVLGGNEALDFVTKLEEFSKNNVRNVIVDLSVVELMNSSGLGMLVSGLRNLRKNDSKMILSGVPQKVNNLLKMTHLDEVFDSYPSIDSAIQGCQ